MRTILAGLVGLLLCMGFAAAVVEQHARAQGRGTPVRAQAPTDRAVDFTRADLESEFRDMAAKGLATVRLLEGGAYNVNIRRLAGAETALVHGKKTDVWVVQEGEGTLVTGGDLVDPRKGGDEGDSSGSAIRGGVTRLIKTGDVVFIPAGLPHGIRQVKDHIVFLNIRFDTR